ncbi:MAG TPA: proline--tRNA ligase [Planctomycetaceae bacterium]|nr:proline--tRNA ligase [Planctomycetaceae bacterium]
MRWSQTLIPTMKEVPAEAEVPSHQLMLRAGLIRQLMAGAYTFLPLGYRSVRKVSEIVRQEMDKAGAIELFMPALQPIEIFERTGRREAFGNVLFNFEVKRGDRKLHFALGPTHEEVITDLMAKYINSYRQLPITLYQIQTKFRNEERPRFGVLRTSEFLMKDAYSFGASLEQLNAAYDAMYNAYCRIFERCGLKYLPVEAESGPIGGDASHEFMVPAENGEDFVVHCPKCGYAANQERADTGRVSQVPAKVDGASAPVKVDTPDAGSIEQVSKLLKSDAKSFIKTLIYKADGKPVAVLLRGDHTANEGKIRRATKATTVELADESTILSVTGAPVGFAGPVGIQCLYIADHDVALIKSAIVGANSADAHLTGVIPGTHFEMSETFDLRNAEADDPCPKCTGTLQMVHGIEVGHVFKLGTKYSVSMDAKFVDDQEQSHPIIMGCYGIGVTRVVASIVETCHDENGIIWPINVAPYTVQIIPLNVSDAEVMKISNTIYGELTDAGIDVLIDDRDHRPGFKFKDADLIGIPLRITIGGKGLAEGIAEVKWRTDRDAKKIPLADVVATVRDLIASVKN